MKEISFCSHAQEKFKILEEHGFSVSKEKVLDVIKKPDKKEKGFKDRFIAQKAIDFKHVLRVVYEEKDNLIVIITFYPGRRSYYEG
ncbi:DUF4258 domain-containing protein [candidate division WOR-1 bacterium RIFOXYA2_FULL_36_21]|uniref:DUF4258 domain-containing protein n=1 Tax=candidate division WOR-1 bacterium RIFOXYB2_FULL_36_35 TaxID=1802578 RepID=A0A1F4S2D3_UNCSA|nr:MAG: DUF4258 domain-containing protein [candidate division WOR-1 bacterium RIFOXYA2_FULL_36_21]OGC14570.1 MAG: DUF4258 domain-containing protein [candidate division WOR-1 bacterium RIFOXYB2_FULL_36_35]OGC16242.1 MAG: DUF4258 domain-containing protein [candidate division WOR-1 bacterium RIFOXYA12_FULL_36_13]